MVWCVWCVAVKQNRSFSLENKSRKNGQGFTDISPNQVAVARLKTGRSQSPFAQALPISARTLQK